MDAFIAVYPDNIIEEYPGFRQDVVYSLGTCFIPQNLSRDRQPNLNFQYVQNPVFNDLWDETRYMGKKYPGVRDESSLAMIFCLKYLTPPEIENWVESIVSIKSPQWYLTVITWWVTFNKFLELVPIWPQDGKLSYYFEATGLLHYATLTLKSFNSFNDFIPKQNLNAFNAELPRHLTLAIFQSWSAEIRSYRVLIVNDDNYPLPEKTILSIEDILADFELMFFYDLA